ncbi:MAG: DNA repair protein RecO [Rhodobacteraceae bacterium]|jgi:DNA repair protein RecO (recombination protein O)|nr:DNA repair protein RecO [Alphaproteobacteria bacterium]MBT8474841.1 DNA repair protein RecO [Alphaproteobacteria bacterium]NNK65188.1 DNA repair protein RecO [Paracoccaceae bacterium]
MVDWRDEGALLSVRRHGETSAIIEVFTREHGRHAGIVRGGTSRKIAPILQPGAQLDVAWRARLEDHLGTFTVEPVKSRAAAVMADRLTLAGLNAATALLAYALPEREAHPQLYARSIALLDMIGNNEAWPLAYLRWEVALLDEMGFGLDLSICAVTGTSDDLAFVSPRTGRAVSAEAAGDWAGRLLPLPPALMGAGQGDMGEIAQGLRTTGHFLTTQLAHSLGDRPLPEARARFVDLVGRAA